MDSFSRSYGFPTGALKNTPPAEALQFFHREGFQSPEIHPRSSTDPLLALGKELFRNASVHLPSSPTTPEDYALEIAAAAVAHHYDRLIVHPYVIRDEKRWKHLGAKLVIENMDFRSPGFMTASDMQGVFSRLPEARFCLDLAHSFGWCADEAGKMIDHLSDRLIAVHYSEIDRITGDHLVEVSGEAVVSHARHLMRVGTDVPIVFETGPSSRAALLELRQRVEKSLSPPVADMD